MTNEIDYSTKVLESLVDLLDIPDSYYELAKQIRVTRRVVSPTGLNGNQIRPSDISTRLFPARNGNPTHYLARGVRPGPGLSTKT